MSDCNCSEETQYQTSSQAQAMLREPTNIEKWKYTLITTAIFIIVSNPLTYVFVNGTLGKLLGKKISNSSGCPTMFGLIVHTIVFTLLLRFIM